MDIKNVHEAKTHFSKLLARVAAGEEIGISRAGKPVARLVPWSGPTGERKGGEWRGLIRIRDDFDAPLPDEIAAAFRGDEE